MPDPRQHKLEALFHRASGLPVADREAFLDEHCSHDATLREDLADLLSQHDRGTRDYLHQQVIDPTATPEPVETPTDIGRYHILETLGEGGMGTVYRAEQHEEVCREVALKVIKAGMDTQRVVKRFETERQTLALLDHPGVARIYDAGSTDAGRPYFVMELVPGQSLTTFCDEHALPIDERLRLFQDVCEAVEYAHDLGIVHRDLKPTNVMVAMRNGRPEPKIIDFGIARVAGDASATQHTLEGEVIGTLDYMSPEQAVPGQSDVDSRSDVYALGAILYELLTGARPHGDALQAVALADAQSILRFKEVAPPSTRIVSMQGSAAESLARVVQSRQSDAATMRRRLRRDLDWIVLKALDKEPHRRYASAADLAADVERHLSHEPVLARPPSRVYRLTKFARRNRVAVAAAGMLALVALLGGAGTALGYLQAKASDERADENDVEAGLTELRVRLQQAIAASGDLVPAWPDKIPAMRRWLQNQAKPLAAELPDLRKRLAVLQDNGDEYTQQEEDRRTHPEVRELAIVEEWMKTRAERRRLGTQTPRGRRLEIANLENHARLQKRIHMRRTCTLPNASDQLLHDALVQLILDLEWFAYHHRAERRQVKQDLELARWNRRNTLVDADVARLWADAREAIRKSDDYDGLDLSPQAGLIPLGENPETGLWEFFHPRSHITGAPRPHHDADGKLVRPDPWSGIVFVLVPGGEFKMGSQKTDKTGPNFDPRRAGDEGPVHDVTLDPFFVSKFEMTRGQWFSLGCAARRTTHDADLQVQQSRDRNPGRRHEHDLPVQNVSWKEARRILNRYGLELPTEAQWEYAARGGTDTPWYTGTDRLTLRGHANFADLVENQTGLARVGAFAPNPFGLHDVCGNLREWCRDSIGPYSRVPRAGDGYRAPVAAQHRFVMRGGAFRSSAAGRSAQRAKSFFDDQSEGNGIRPVRPVFGPERANPK
jgi:formylglycine-generating enzyme required for sulfatase activity